MSFFYEHGSLTEEVVGDDSVGTDNVDYGVGSVGSVVYDMTLDYSVFVHPINNRRSNKIMRKFCD